MNAVTTNLRQVCVRHKPGFRAIDDVHNNISHRPLVPRLLEKDITPLVDTDGDVTLMVPWQLREGIGGVLPLERQAGG